MIFKDAVLNFINRLMRREDYNACWVGLEGAGHDLT